MSLNIRIVSLVNGKLRLGPCNSVKRQYELVATLATVIYGALLWIILYLRSVTRLTSRYHSSSFNGSCNVLYRWFQFDQITLIASIACLRRLVGN